MKLLPLSFSIEHRRGPLHLAQSRRAMVHSRTVPKCFSPVWRAAGTKRYAIVSRNNLADAMRKLEISERTEIGHEISHTRQTATSEAKLEQVN